MPHRIASLLASATEILYGLELGEQVVAVSHECDFPPQATLKPRATFTHVAVAADSRQIDAQVRELAAAGAPLYEIDTQLLVSLAPDLIVTQAQCDVCAVRYEDVLSLVRDRPELRNTQVVALNPTTLAGIFADIRRVGAATDRLAEAEAYVAALQARVAAVRQTTGNLPLQQRPRVACVEWIEPIMLAANWMPDLIELAGGQQPFTESGRHSTYSSWEQVVAWDPEVIVVMPCGFDLERTVTEARVMSAWPDWDRLTAVRNERVYAVDGNALFNRSGPRIVDSLEVLARLIHPQLFRPTDLAQLPNTWRRLEDRATV